MIFKQYDDHRADRRTAAGTDRNIVVARVLDEVPDDEKVRSEAHLGDDAELVLEPLAQRRVVRGALARRSARSAPPRRCSRKYSSAVRSGAFGLPAPDTRGRWKIFSGIRMSMRLAILTVFSHGFGKIAPELAHLFGDLT